MQDVVKKATPQEEEHSLFSPSGADKWVNCTGSPWMSKGIEEGSSEYAAEGTLAHSWAEHFMSKKDYFIEEDDKNVPADMIPFLNVYMATCKSMSEGASLRLVEQKVDLSSVLKKEGEKGTSDFIALVGSELQVHDLKYGRGVKVYAKENKQLMLYALGALELMDIMSDVPVTQVRLVIHMPRLYDVSEWVTTPDELYKFRDLAREKINEAGALLESDSEPPSSCFAPAPKTCQWCAAGRAGRCKFLDEYLMSKALGDFEDLTIEEKKKKLKDEIKKVTESDIEDLAEIFELLPLFAKWIEAKKTFAVAQAEAGVKIPRHKLVLGNQGRRKWSDPEKAVQYLKNAKLKLDEIFEKKPISPTKAEKIVGKRPRVWKNLVGVMTQSPAKPTLVSEKDKRSEIVVKPPVDDFEDLTGTENKFDDLI